MNAADCLADLEAATRAAEAAEADYRKEIARRTAALAQERAFAFRRLNLMRAVAAAVEAAPDEETGVAHGLAMLRSRLGWTTPSEARDEIVSRFAPVCVALRGEAPEDPAKVMAKADPRPTPREALAAFEAWYVTARGTPFWTLFEVYAQETPLVDW